jgi:Na+/H+ antiporter NhaD/arsenite permease-like protein
MDLSILLVFIAVYLGMILGRIPGLALDRTGVALLGAIALLVLGRVSLDEAWMAIDVPTITLLFGLMVISAQFRLGGFYTAVTRRLAGAEVTPPTLLALLIGTVGLLSALLANDIVCLAMAPVLAEGCARRGLDPKPFLLALACAANVGSAATLIGNPQNMLIGQALDLSFAGYLPAGGVPALLGLAATWWVINRLTGNAWRRSVSIEPVEAPPLDRWQTGKGLTLLAMLVGAFLLGTWPREILALAAAGVLLASRRMHTRQMLGLVDWQLLVLFIGLFVVNHALAASGMLAAAMAFLGSAGIELVQPAWLFAVTIPLSNLVSNVPAVMLLLPVADHPLAGPVLALSSTLAGNLFIVGSIANIIVVDQAARLGIVITWREHARIGVPVTILTLAIAAGWLLILA